MLFIAASCLCRAWKANGVPTSGNRKMPIARIQPITRNGARSLQAPKRPSSALNIREAFFEDHSSITALQVRNGLTTRSYEEWSALWNDNPVYQRIRGNWPIGWVLE